MNEVLGNSWITDENGVSEITSPSGQTVIVDAEELGLLARSVALSLGYQEKDQEIREDNILSILLKRKKFVSLYPDPHPVKALNESQYIEKDPPDLEQ